MRKILKKNRFPFELSWQSIRQHHITYISFAIYKNIFIEENLLKILDCSKETYSTIAMPNLFWKKVIALYLVRYERCTILQIVKYYSWNYYCRSFQSPSKLECCNWSKMFFIRQGSQKVILLHVNTQVYVVLSTKKAVKELWEILPLHVIFNKLSLSNYHLF